MTQLVEAGMRWVVDGEGGSGISRISGRGAGTVGSVSGVEDEDTRWMGQAVREAARGVGYTSPNPPVGAVIVSGGSVVGRGYHRAAGSPHAEVEAIRDAGAGRCRGATIYVTLEPCSTHGRTPPCCEAIRAAGIARVVYGSTDPNPLHAGAAGAIMRAAEIEVTAGVALPETDPLIEAFTKRVTSGLPWVVAKIGQSLDGRITRPPGESRWLTGLAAREDAHFLRGRSDAIVVGPAPPWPTIRP